MKKRRIQKWNKKVRVFRIRVPSSPSYATRSVTLILTVSIGWQETFIEMESHTFISNCPWPPARRAEGTVPIFWESNYKVFSIIVHVFASIMTCKTESYYILLEVTIIVTVDKETCTFPTAFHVIRFSKQKPCPQNKNNKSCPP